MRLVTLVLGPRASEYLKGIPESDVPEIISDLIERSLAGQVRPLFESKKEDGNNVSNQMNLDEDTIDRLKSLFSEVVKDNISGNVPIQNYNSSFDTFQTSSTTDKFQNKSAKVEKYDGTNVDLDSDDEDLDDFFSDLIK